MPTARVGGAPYQDAFFDHRMALRSRPGSKVHPEVPVRALDLELFPGRKAGKGALNQEVCALFEAEVLKVDSRQR
jgi:hypothetical protein